MQVVPTFTPHNQVVPIELIDQAEKAYWQLKEAHTQTEEVLKNLEDSIHLARMNNVLFRGHP